MMRRAASQTLAEAKASDSWASTPATPAAFFGGVEAVLHAQAQKADGAGTGAQRGVSPTSVATDRTGDKPDQSGSTRLGELLRRWALQRVLQLHQGLGGEEG